MTMEPEGIPRNRTDAPNRVYYLDIGAGTWQGTATFRVTSWARLRHSDIGLTNKLLVTAMHVIGRLVGAPRQHSTIVAKPDEGAFGQADNVLKISKFGVMLYLLDEQYVLESNGTGVVVRAKERLGPVPGLFTRTFTYTAEIRDEGMAATYRMPLLGAMWTADYRVAPDRRSLAAELLCDWGRATEDTRLISAPA
ncbi:hypothetical protein [Streptomyces roseicoloratus]|uniref:Uncharacterized protein n=1 Tax=Streptomyces roseicoloratus TaxID=2508722 RepID=A0ABY9S229_9ACTN|nr:hypothetical protein [Streptomyces roseicoloratus]WMX48471.1 hypothetical protein RGF97_31795 [Streptomyces roseicoloratus]